MIRLRFTEKQPNPMNPLLKRATLQFTQWMTAQALPLWANTGFDHQAGCVFEQLLPDGSADLTCNKRMLVQARQMYVFATAAERGWLDVGEQRVTQILQFTRGYGLKTDHHVVAVQKISPNHQPLDATQDIYDISFFLLSCAARYRAFKDQAAIEQAAAIMAHLNSQLNSPYGGWLEGNYPTKNRRQNPHMHLFEAFIALFEVTHDTCWLTYATSIFNLFTQHFYDKKRELVLEYFYDDWAPLSAHDGQSVEPGHMLEWVWLLYRYHKITGTKVGFYTNALFQKATEIGQEVATGLIFDECRLDGIAIRTTKRCWPITELIKASLAVADLGDKKTESVAAQAINNLFKYYLNTAVSGGYCDQLSECNIIINNTAPASTLYHLMVALTQAIDYMHGQH